MRCVATWVKVCSIGDIPEGEVSTAECNGAELMLVRAGDAVYAADKTCTHAEADLSGGFVAPGAGPDGAPGVRCPLHLSVFELKSGIPLNPPAEAPLRTYRTRIDGDAVYVEV